MKYTVVRGYENHVTPIMGKRLGRSESYFWASLGYTVLAHTGSQLHTVVSKPIAQMNLGNKINGELNTGFLASLLTPPPTQYPD